MDSLLTLVLLYNLVQIMSGHHSVPELYMLSEILAGDTCIYQVHHLQCGHPPISIYHPVECAQHCHGHNFLQGQLGDLA